LQYAADELRADCSIVYAAVRQNSAALQYALEVDGRIVLLVMNRDGQAWKKAALPNWSDRRFVLTMVKQQGNLLGQAARELQEDRAIVSAAVRQCGWALQHASMELRKDRYIARLAVRQSRRALQYVAPQIRAESDSFKASDELDNDTNHTEEDQVLTPAEIELELEQQLASDIAACSASSPRLHDISDLVKAPGSIGELWDFAEDCDVEGSDVWDYIEDCIVIQQLHS